MAATKKRKHVSVADQSAERTSLHDLKAFASVRKFPDVDNGTKKRKTIHQHDLTPPPIHTLPTQFDKKRKRDLEVAEEDMPADELNTFENALNSSAKERPVATPLHKRAKNIQPQSTAESPSKSAMAMFHRMKLDANVKAVRFALDACQQTYQTPPATPDGEQNLEFIWPVELEYLIALNAAMLSALSLYYAHNGTTSPVNVEALLPMITKTWKKRSATLDDLRMLLNVGQKEESTLELQDFGRAGICLTMLQPRGRATKRAASYVDEADLKSRFEDALRKRWSAWLSVTPKENQEVSVFLDQLPLAQITTSESVEKAAPMFARGHQRLKDLKAGQAASNAEELHPSKLVAEQKTASSVQSRGTNLLDRILAKQALTSSLPSGPTKEQLERKAALYRVEDIARVLELLATGRPRCSFSMQAMVQQLQQSLRNPISRDEVEKCLGIMAMEIMPTFVSLVKSGSVTGVVVTKGGRVGHEELRRRLDVALA